jgi:hypothetical protein
LGFSSREDGLEAVRVRVDGVLVLTETGNTELIDAFSYA